MKKLLTFVCTLICLFGLVGCVQKESSEESIISEDFIPMVMVGGELYLDTGHEASSIHKCGVMDGEITSTVKNSQKPTKDNQSNFGKGYGYQYSSQDGLIEIYVNEKWCVFATEKALASSQLMIDSVVPASIHNIFTEECANISDDEDIETISSILLVDSWNVESLTNCSNNIEITIDGTTYLYHSDCGTFNDILNQRYLSLDDETTNIVNTLFAKYVSLTSVGIPEE